MFKKVLTKVFGTQFEREVKKIQPVVDEINRIFPELSSLSEDELKHKTVEFKEKIQDRIAAKQQLLEELERSYDETSDDNEKDKIGFQIDDAQKDLDNETAKVLDEILPEAYAVIKETCRRLGGTSWSVRGRETKWNMIPYDVQLIGAIALHKGMVTEMKTGEGKTLVATMPLYLNALVGKGSHLITVNDYLAQRDSEWMGPVSYTHLRDHET